MNENQARELIAQLGKSLYDRGLAHGSAGNISVRLGGALLVTPTNSCLGRLDPARISRLDSAGKLVFGDGPSKETGLHLSMYRERASATAVVHLHCVHSVAVSCLSDINRDNVFPPLTPYALMQVGKLPLVPYYSPGDAELAEAVARLAGKHHAVLLANHGPVVAGSSLSAAVNAIEELEQSAQLMLLLRGLPTQLLTPAQVVEINRRFPT